MSTKTREELVNKALFNLEAVGSGQEPTDEDYDRVDEAVDPLIEQLEGDDICIISDLEEIPASHFLYLAELLANACASEFGKPFAADKKEYFETRLKRITSSRPSFEPLKTDYF